jgi:hypothetical protein
MAKSTRTPKVTKSLEELWERVKEAEQYHEKYFVEPAKVATGLLRGNVSFMPSGFDSELDIIHPNLIFSTIRTYTPALYPDYPDIYVRPRAEEWIKDKRERPCSVCNDSRKGAELLSMPVEDEAAG